MQSEMSTQTEMKLTTWPSEYEMSDKDLAELRSQGVEVAMEPFNEGQGRLSFVKDPDGIWIELEGPRRE